jgi:[CysO sulfur-carrier protein]-S-L-cysteine hydrolase
MSEVVVRLTREHLDRMVAHAHAEAPYECCGLLAGRGEVVEEVFPGRNQDQSPWTYLMDPQDQLRAFRTMDQRGWELVGIYHSHPHTDAHPSRIDVAKALYPDARYVIISLATSSEPEVKAFRIVDGQIAEEEVVVT